MVLSMFDNLLRLFHEVATRVDEIDCEIAEKEHERAEEKYFKSTIEHAHVAANDDWVYETARLAQLLTILYYVFLFFLIS